MSASPDAVMRQWFQEVWNERREEAIDRLMAPDAKVHGLAGGVIDGPEAFKPFYRAFCGAFEDLRVDVVQTVVEGDRVAALCHVTGRHAGDALGGKATGRSIDLWATRSAASRTAGLSRAGTRSTSSPCISRSGG